MVGSQTLGEDQVRRFLHLGFPQSHGAIANLLGHPEQRSAAADRYRLPNGHSLTVHYAGPTATGYTLGDSGE